MHRCRHRQVVCLVLVLPLAAAGCEETRPPRPDAPAAPAVDAASDFDPATAGSIHGQVVWNGDLPEVAPFRARVHPFEEAARDIVRENPNAPVIDSKTRGVGNAVVFLRGVDPRRSRPWDHPPVRVEQRDYRLHVCQGEADSRVGFVRRGAAVEVVSRQRAFHSLRAGGAAFFTLTFPDPDQPLSRRLEQRGVVELSSAAGHYWMRAYLFVDDHPCYARTDTEGRFSLTEVPPGNYEAVCWVPSWHKDRHERNPESTLVMRWFFQPPAEVTRPVTLQPGESRDLRFTVSAEVFEGR